MDEDTKRPPIFNMTDEELAATADLDFSQNEPAGSKEGNDPPEPREKATRQKQHLDHLLDRERLLGEAATRPVVFSPPLISRGETGIIGRGTINVIQGAYGSHKSRLAELFATLMLARNPGHSQFLDFVRQQLERYCVCYLDTERNQNEELPFAIQNIKLKAGYTLDETPVDFRFTSIKGVPRNDRFAALDAYIGRVRHQTDLHLFCLIDVVTDAIGDFNDPKESMKLFDFLGNLCDKYDATFLLVIHQNPGTEKARGHTGTEAANKASTALQIGFERDGSGNDTDLIRLRYLKLRRGKRPEPVYLQYSEQAKGLVMADAASVAAHVNNRKLKADTEDIADRLTSLLSEGPLPKHEVCTILEKEFKAKNTTIRGRLKSILDERPAMFDQDGHAVQLTDYIEGRGQFYKLTLVD